MTDPRDAWGGLCGLSRRPRRRHQSPHVKYGKTYHSNGRPSIILSAERLRVAQKILRSLGKEKP